MSDIGLNILVKLINMPNLILKKLPLHKFLHLK